jgi:hypothetical protein
VNTERYLIVIRGIIDQSWSAYFSGVNRISYSGDLTGICVEIADQSALYGLLNQIHDLNLRLVSIRLLDSDGVTPVECRYCQINKAPAERNKPSNTTFSD